jgi:uncharacterized membrane protein YjjB (DUF3815 family)
MSVGAVALAILEDALWSGVAALGFAIMFNVPVRTLLACALCGASGHAIRTALLQTEVGIELATLCGATVIGVLAELFARRWNAPATVFAVPGLIPMVPGTFAYSTMIGLLELTRVGAAASPTLLADVATNAVKTGLIVTALAVGIIAPGTLAWLRRPQHT